MPKGIKGFQKGHKDFGGRPPKGTIPWNKGKKDCYSEETIKKISSSLKDHPSWNKGKKTGALTAEHKRKIANAVKGKNAMQNNGRWAGGKSTWKGYVLIYKPNHPYAKNIGYIFEHRLIMEKYLGRYLKKGEIVHHKNRVRNDNRIENLELLDNVQHLLQHWKEWKLKKRQIKN